MGGKLARGSLIFTCSQFMPQIENIDSNIINQASTGDRAACSALVNKYRDALIAYISNIVPNHEDAEDICQESFQKCFNNLSSYNHKYAFSTWLYTIAQNTSFDFLRKNRIPSAATLSEAEVNAQKKTSNTALSPEDVMINNQAIENVLKAIQKMPPIYRRVSELRFIQDYPLEEISKELNLPLNTVKTRVSRAKKLLNEIWKS